MRVYRILLNGIKWTQIIFWTLSKINSIPKDQILAILIKTQITWQKGVKFFKIIILNINLNWQELNPLPRVLSMVKWLQICLIKAKSYFSTKVLQSWSSIQAARMFLMQPQAHRTITNFTMLCICLDKARSEIKSINLFKERMLETHLLFKLIQVTSNLASISVWQRSIWLFKA